MPGKRKTSYLKAAISATITPQNKPILGRESEMVKNNAGGYVFDAGMWTQLDRFLILGSEGGTYYVKQRELTQQNAQNTIKCIREDGIKTVKHIVEISDQGRAPKNDPAIFALALCTAFGNEETKRAAFESLPKVCRIGTHIYQFADFVEEFRGWGRGLRKAIAGWYLNRPIENLALQAIKYRQRGGWTHRDLLRLSHPKIGQELLDKKDQAAMDRNELFKFIVKQGDYTIQSQSDSLRLIEGYQKVNVPGINAKEIDRLIKEYKLPREALPTEALRRITVWEALLDDMPAIALIRNLAKMTEVGLLKPFSAATKKVCQKLSNEEMLKKARMHPIQVLAALRTYAKGRGERGKLTWKPVAQYKKF